MKKIILICTTLLLVLAGCRKELNENQTEQTEQTEQQQISEQIQHQSNEITENLPIQEGGTLSLSMRNAETLNPLLNQDASVDTILKLIYMPLIKLDQNHKPSPCIAQSWSFDEGGTVLSLNLRNDIYWQNGTNLTADDVIYSFNTLSRAADANAVYKDCMNYIRSYTKTSDYSINITFQQNFSGNLYALLMPIISSMAVM